MVDVYIFLTFVLIVAGGVYLCLRSERKIWNHGICNCGKGFWLAVDQDAHGGTIYRCTTCEQLVGLNFY